MSRARAVLFLVLFTLLLPLLFVQFLHRQAADAAADSPTDVARNVGVVIDTTDSMGPELNFFSSAWRDPLTATFRLATFKDTAQYQGSTTSYDTFSQQLASLEAVGGGSCPDNALGGLLEMGKNLPTNKTLASDVVLVTDATPLGNRANYVYVINKMLRRGVNVHALASGWCSGAPIPEVALQFLAQATGGHYYKPAVATDYYTETVMVHDKLFATDLLLSHADSVSSGFPDTIPLAVDSSMTGMSAESWRGCLTCPYASTANTSVAVHISASPGVQIDLRDPDGIVLDGTTAGFDQMSSSSRQLVRVYPPLTAPLKTGQWDIRVSGDGSYNLSVVAQSSLHFAYLGPGTVPQSQPSLLRVALGELDGQVIRRPLTEAFKLTPYDGVGATQSIDLYDDGKHSDGVAGDGIYGGMVQPTAAGWWRLAAEGKLADGTAFQRLAEVPLRVQSYHINSLMETASASPDVTLPITFTVKNDTAGTNVLAADGVVAAATTTFDLELFSEQGWTITDTIPASVTLAPGETYTVTTSVVIPADAPAGAVEESTLVAVDPNDLNSQLAAVAEVSVIERVYLPLIVK